MRTKSAVVIGVIALLSGASAVSANEGEPAAWQRRANNEVANLPSVQRGAHNFMAYCSGCHSLKYMRYSRLATDLKFTDAQRDQFIVKPGDKFSDYIKSSMPAADAQDWFGKQPPDLSLVTRSRGPDWVFNFLTTFYADSASRQTGVNNLQLPGTAMPHVLAALQGVQALAPKEADEHKAVEPAEGEHAKPQVFVAGIAGSMTPEQYDAFVRDTVNFLAYVGDPTQLDREAIGLWVVLFLLMFTGIAYMLKSEYWKDVR
jgi:ubiquinol-cytochrome c reductase cytochrome c1 subunit